MKLSEALLQINRRTGIFRSNWVCKGADPEVFVIKDGNPISSGVFIKKQPFTAYSGMVIRDGFQLELNPYPSPCRETLILELARILRDLYATCKQDSFALSRESTVLLDRKTLASLDKESKRFGCAPDFNAYTGKENSVTIDGETWPERYAGGHMHAGPPDYYDSVNNQTVDVWHKNAEDIVKVMDAVIGNFCVLLDRKGGIRAKYYGQAGAFRRQPHGLEYRVPSNFWLMHPGLTHIIFGLLDFSFFIWEYKLKDALFTLVKEEDVATAINDFDFKLARENYTKIEPIFDACGGRGIDEFYSTSGISPNTIDLFNFLVEKGIDKFVSDDIFKNWGIADNKQTPMGIRFFRDINMEMKE